MTFHHITSRRVGIVSTRLLGNDGVSLETNKWVRVINKLGHECFYFAGESNYPQERCLLVEQAHFEHPDIIETYTAAFTERQRRPEITRRIQILKNYLKDKLYQFVDLFDIELLLVENALSIPMNIPLGLALTEVIAETSIQTIAHHHDFFWERKRFLVNCVWDYLNMAFPPHLPSIHHVVINSSGANQLSLRTGVSCELIPNVMDFENPPSEPDGYTSDARDALGVEQDELFFLQPTRVVPRKGIEHAILLIKQLGLKARLVISHASGDEGPTYEKYLRQYAETLDVPVNFVADIIRDERGTTDDGRKIYSLWDIYPLADLVTYPSSVEGFGNAFLEAIYFQRPIIVNSYSIFDTDIKPKGFQVIEFDGFVGEGTIQEVRELMSDPARVEKMTAFNYQRGKRYYSFSVLERRLATLLADCFGEENTV